MAAPVPRPQGVQHTATGVYGFRERHASPDVPPGRTKHTPRRGPANLRVAEGTAREETFMVEDDFGPWDD